MVPAPQGEPIYNNQLLYFELLNRIKRTSMDLRDVGQLAKDLRVSQWDVDDSVVGKGRERVKRGDLLSST